MKILRGAESFFAIDIGTNSVRVAEVKRIDKQNWSLEHAVSVQADSKLTSSDSPEVRKKLGEVILTAIGQSGVSTRNVAVGVPSSKGFTTVIDVPRMPQDELRSTMRYQLDQYIPMSIDDAQVDWKFLGPSLHDPKQDEVLICSTASTFSEDRLEFFESLGLNVIALEPDPIAMIRSLSPAAPIAASMIVDMGSMSTDVAIIAEGSPRLIRSLPSGFTTLTKAAVQNLNVQEEQARQFILKFGLAQDRLEGQVLRALESVLDNFANELTKSITFFRTRYPNTQIDSMMVSGFVASIPGLSDYIASKTGVKVTIANPWTKVRVSQQMQQSLAPVMNEFATVVGLAMREGNV